MKSMFKGALGALTVALVLSGLTATSALASGAPTAETKPATASNESSAYLNGVVNPNGAETKYYFEYGTTVSYGKTTVEASAGSGSVPVEVTQGVKGLAPGTTYHIRIVATNSNGTAHGADVEYKYNEYPPGLPEFSSPVKELKTSTFKASYVPGTTWEKAGTGSRFECESDGTFNGKFLTSKTVSGTIVFKGCKAEADECKSTGATEGEIKTVELEGTLVYRSKASKTVALLLKPKSGELIVPNFQCKYSGEVRGTILMPLAGPINKPTGRIEVKKLQENGEYENGVGSKKKALLETDWIKEWAALTWQPNYPEEFTITTSENIEIKA